MMDRERLRRKQEREIKRMTKTTSLLEGKGVVYSLVSSAETSLDNALKMAKKNKKMKSLVPSIQAALDAVRGIE